LHLQASNAAGGTEAAHDTADDTGPTRVAAGGTGAVCGVAGGTVVTCGAAEGTKGGGAPGKPVGKGKIGRGD
jgi:hypothetical protein